MCVRSSLSVQQREAAAAWFERDWRQSCRDEVRHVAVADQAPVSVLADQRSRSSGNETREDVLLVRVQARSGRSVLRWGGRDRTRTSAGALFTGSGQELGVDRPLGVRGRHTKGDGVSRSLAEIARLPVRPWLYAEVFTDRDDV